MIGKGISMSSKVIVLLYYQVIIFLSLQIRTKKNKLKKILVRKNRRSKIVYQNVRQIYVFKNDIKHKKSSSKIRLKTKI